MSDQAPPSAPVQLYLPKQDLIPENSLLSAPNPLPHSSTYPTFIRQADSDAKLQILSFDPYISPAAQLTIIPKTANLALLLKEEDEVDKQVTISTKQAPGVGDEDDISEDQQVYDSLEGEQVSQNEHCEYGNIMVEETETGDIGRIGIILKAKD